MKKIIITNIDNSEKDIIIKNKMNSLIDKTNDKYYFNSFFSDSVEIEIKENNLNKNSFNKKLEENLISLIKPSLKIAASLSSESLGVEKNKNSLIAPIGSIINKYNYCELEKVDIFDFVTDLFIMYLNGHYLYNGNKRFSFCFLVYLVSSFGYYFKFTQGSWKNYELYINIIEKFAKDLENQKDILELNNKVRQEVKK